MIDSQLRIQLRLSPVLYSFAHNIRTISGNRAIDVGVPIPEVFIKIIYYCAGFDHVEHPFTKLFLGQS